VGGGDAGGEEGERDGEGGDCCWGGWGLIVWCKSAGWRVLGEVESKGFLYAARSLPYACLNLLRAVEHEENVCGGWLIS